MADYAFTQHPRSCAFKLEDYMASSSLRCAVDSKFSFQEIHALPTATQIDAMCQSGNCTALLGEIQALAPTECVTKEGAYLYEDLVGPILERCPSAVRSLTTNSTAFSPAESAVTVPSATTSPSPSPIESSGVVTARRDVHVHPVVIAVAVVACCVCFLLGFVAAKRPCVRRKPRSRAYASTSSPRDALLREQTLPGPNTTKTKTTAGPGENAAGDMLAALLEDRQIVTLRIPFEKIMLDERLASMSSNEVYRATYNGAFVVVKKMPPSNRTDASSVNQFLAHAKRIASLDHERVVAFVGVAWRTVEELCVVTEYLEGGNLRSLLSVYKSNNKRTGFDKTKLRIALHIAHALTYLHSFDPPVIHRNVSTSNILLTSDFHAKLGGFGAPVESGSLRPSSSLWTARELMSGTADDEKVDVFAFGMVLAEVDWNQAPSRPADEFHFEDAIEQAAISFSDTCDAGIAALGLSCVAVDPAKRPTAAEVLYHIHQLYELQ